MEMPAEYAAPPGCGRYRWIERRRRAIKLSSTHDLIFARLGSSCGQGLSPVVPAKRKRAMAEVQTTGTQAVVRNISDTSRWAAVFRARETERTDALFRDPYAERLAGKMGVDIANTLPEGNS